MSTDIEHQSRYESSTSLATARWADPAYIANQYAYKPGAIWLGRNPHNPEQEIGYADDRHVFICAETRSGKGRALLVNNQVLWPGSMITVGPKGEEATICAPRRGQGNEYCEGMGQDVYVLDPLSCTEVPEHYRAHFNLLAALDPDDGELVSKVDRIANAICTIPDAAEAAEWSKEGKDYVANVILHVVTTQSPYIEDRDLLTVRDLVLQGDIVAAEDLKDTLKSRGEEEKARNIDPYILLLSEMINNPACDGAIGRNARDMLQSAKKHVKYFESVRKGASRHLRFLEGQGISRTVRAPNIDRKGYKRTFRIEDIKDKELSIFLCLPEDSYEPLDRWLRAMIEVLLGGLQQNQGIGKNGNRVLFCIDEFANLGRMNGLAKATNSIAGAGVKLMFAVQRLGDLQELYGKSWEKFIAAAGTQIWFGAEEVATGEYLEKKLGKTEVTKLGRSINQGTSTALAEGVNEGYSHTNSLNTSKTKGESSSTTESTSKATSESIANSKGWNTNYGKTAGKSSGEGYGPHIFFRPFSKNTNSGTSSTRQKGGGKSKQTTESTGITNTTGHNTTIGSNTSDTEGSGSSTTETGGTQTTRTNTETEGASIQESFHVRPLLSLDEAKQLLISPSDVEHPAYPGFALITLAEEKHPFFIRKSNHDQDPKFAGKFNPNPAHPFLNLSEQPLLGWQITEEYFFNLELPLELDTEPFSITTASDFTTGFILQKGDPFLHITHTESAHSDVTILAPFTMMIVKGFHADQFDNSGHVLTFRGYQPLENEERIALESHFWGTWLDEARSRIQKQQEKQEQERRRKLDEIERKNVSFTRSYTPSQAGQNAVDTYDDLRENHLLIIDDTHEKIIPSDLETVKRAILDTENFAMWYYSDHDYPPRYKTTSLDKYFGLGASVQTFDQGRHGSNEWVNMETHYLVDGELSEGRDFSMTFTCYHLAMSDRYGYFTINASAYDRTSTKLTGRIHFYRKMGFFDKIKRMPIMNDPVSIRLIKDKFKSLDILCHDIRVFGEHIPHTFDWSDQDIGKKHMLSWMNWVHSGGTLLLNEDRNGKKGFEIGQTLIPEDKIGYVHMPDAESHEWSKENMYLQCYQNGEIVYVAFNDGDNIEYRDRLVLVARTQEAKQRIKLMLSEQAND